MPPDGADELSLDFTYGEVLFWFAYEFVYAVLVLVGLVLLVGLLIVVTATVIMGGLYPVLRRLSDLRRGHEPEDDRGPRESALWWLGEEADLPGHLPGEPNTPAPAGQGRL
ncbi:hypothetical protein ACIBF6_12810 [Streptosporangium amethystogenes]|uniref:hypothetical protein n=1 Tax=Streptosporangium amethystogenes TaxID=2002 RepID=UPI0037A67088